MNARTRFLFDARWAGHGGIGRVTAQLASGLGDARPAGDWTVWTRDPSLAWEGSNPALSSRAPTAWTGQRSFFEVPSCDVAFFPANLRPLRPVGRASATLIYDTIPIRWASTPRRAAMSRLVFGAAAHLSTKVLTISEFSARKIVDDLRISADKVVVIPIPLERTLAPQVTARRSVMLSEVPTVAFIGRFAPHKNLERLVLAFSKTQAAVDGARLVLAGGVGSEAARLQHFVDDHAISGVVIRGQLTHDELIDLYASSWVVAFPSLEEGLGLPVLEATSAGIPVVASCGGAIPEVVGDRLDLVDPTNTQSIAAGIDAAIGQAGVAPAHLATWIAGLPTVADMTQAALDEINSLAR